MKRLFVILLLSAACTPIGWAALPSWSVPAADDLNNNMIVEEIATGGEIGVLVAIDTDDEPITYSIDDLSDNEVNEPGGERDAFDYLSVDSNTGNVSVLNRIDYETFQRIKARWVAENSFGKKKSDVITMYVTNINDNPPVFLNTPPFTEDVFENETVGSPIYTARANDDDGDDIIYFLSDNAPDCEQETFEVDSSSGDVLVHQTLDYSRSVQYVVCIQAKDDSTLEPRNFSHISDETFQLLVSIRDVQNLPPVFYNQPYDSHIPENIAIGSSVEKVFALDGDLGVDPPNAINFTLLFEDEDPALFTFEIDPHGDIYVLKGLNRETEPITELFTLKVQAKEDDSSQPDEQITSTANVYIRLNDVDDNKPRFQPNTTVTATIPEHSPRGTQLDFGLEAYDNDLNEAGTILLELENDNDLFYLASETIYNYGVVDVRVLDSDALDFENIDKINTTFQIKGISATNSSIYSKVDAVVSITNVNDNTPEFSKPQYDVLLDENQEGGTHVVQLEATDDDVMDEVTFDISGFNEGWFDINPTTGFITTSDEADFDAELLSVYFLTCFASDGERISTSLLNITIRDINDNAPEFQYATYEAAINQYIIEDIEDRRILQVVAIDADISYENRILTYHIVSGNEEDKFEIIQDMGEILRKQSIDEGNIYTLVVEAVDSGTPPLSGTTNVTISVVANPPEASHLTTAMIASFSLAGVMLLVVACVGVAWFHSLRRYKWILRNAEMAADMADDILATDTQNNNHKSSGEQSHANETSSVFSNPIYDASNETQEECNLMKTTTEVTDEHEQNHNEDSQEPTDYMSEKELQESSGNNIGGDDYEHDSHEEIGERETHLEVTCRTENYTNDETEMEPNFHQENQETGENSAGEELQEPTGNSNGEEDHEYNTDEEIGEREINIDVDEETTYTDETDGNEQEASEEIQEETENKEGGMSIANDEIGQPQSCQEVHETAKHTDGFNISRDEGDEISQTYSDEINARNDDSVGDMDIDDKEQTADEVIRERDRNIDLSDVANDDDEQDSSDDPIKESADIDT